jgi:Zn-dependent protease
VRAVNLSFRLGKIPVRIQPSFLVMAVVLGLLGVQDVAVVGSWVVIVLVSVMLHELGHATMGLAFGLSPQIDLHGMGGTTSWAPSAPLSSPKRIAISLAGPGAGFVVAAVVFAVGRARFPHSPLGDIVYRNLLFVNFGWGLVNLLPMLPLDGGNVMTQVLQVLTRGKGERPARIVSIVVAILSAVAVFLVSFTPGEGLSYAVLWPVLLAASFVSLNVRALGELRAREDARALSGGPPSP